MNLFGKKDKSYLDYKPKQNYSLLEDVKPPTIDYVDVIEYLVGLSEGDYKKVTKCTKIARKAYADQCKILGIENEPTTFIAPPLLGTDVELGNFLEHDQTTSNKKIKIDKKEKPKK